MLLDLPSELLWAIWDELVSTSDQNALILTCCLFRRSFNDALYHQLIKSEYYRSRKALGWAASNNRQTCIQKLLQYRIPLELEPEHDSTVESDRKHHPNRPYFMLTPSNGPSNTDWFEYTPLVRAVQRGHLNIVHLLLDAGANPNARGRAHDLPVMAAVRGRQAGTLRMLLSAGADAHILINYWGTLLAYAADDGELEIVELLLANAGSSGYTQRQLRTAVEFATRASHEEVVDRIMKAGTSVNARFFDD
ncbi:ankyrin repeat-containing domain protein [Aspergillus unguis]